MIGWDGKKDKYFFSHNLIKIKIYINTNFCHVSQINLFIQGIHS